MSKSTKFGDFLAQRVAEAHEEAKQKSNNGNMLENNDTSCGDVQITTSKTQNALQINWRTPCEFPLCPQSLSDNPLQEYLDNLKPGAMFSKNQYGHSVVVKADFDRERTAVFVITGLGKDAIKGNAVAKITYHSTEMIFYHESCGTFFDSKAAEKYFAIERGHEWIGGPVLDDFC